MFESSEHTKLSEKLNAIISSNRDTTTTKRTMDETKLMPPTQPIRIKSILKNPSSSSASLSTMETTKGSIKTSTSHLHCRHHHRLDCSASSSITTATNLTSTSLPDETSSFRTTDDFIKSLTASEQIGRLNRQRKRITSQPPRNFFSVNPTTVASGATTVTNKKKRSYKRTYPQHEKTVELVTFFGKFSWI